MHEVLVNRLGGLSLPRKSVVRLIDRPDMTLDVYRGRKTTMQQQQQILFEIKSFTGALRNTDHEVSVPKCPGKWLYFINQGQLFQINYINTG